jgi:hydrogenase maturation protein HypF
MQFTKIELPFVIKSPTLALGPQTKNTVCFARGGFAYLGPVHQDIGCLEDFLDFEKTVKHFLKQNPKTISYDLHPEYASSKYALSLSGAYRLFPVQHHHAHIAACMAENRLKNQKVIGVAFDGTGLGSDGTLWGGEFLTCDYRNFKREGHLRAIPLLGSEKAIQEPWRIAAFWLHLAYRERFFNLGIPFTKQLDRHKWRILQDAHISGFNWPLASSMGRLFDALGSIVTGKNNADFEAELAIALERLAARNREKTKGYAFTIDKTGDGYVLDPAVLFREVVFDLKHREPKEKIAYKIHSSVSQAILKICLLLREKDKINKVVLSGGVFQNKLLLSLSLELLYKEDFSVFLHNLLPCNDSGLSLGQAIIAGLRS